MVTVFRAHRPEIVIDDETWAALEAKAEALLALVEGAMLLSAIHDDPATAGRLAKLALGLARASD